MKSSDFEAIRHGIEGPAPRTVCELQVFLECKPYRDMDSFECQGIWMKSSQVEAMREVEYSFQFDIKIEDGL